MAVKRVFVLRLVLVAAMTGSLGLGAIAGSASAATAGAPGSAGTGQARSPSAASERIEPGTVVTIATTGWKYINNGLTCLNEPDVTDQKGLRWLKAWGKCTAKEGIERKLDRFVADTERNLAQVKKSLDQVRDMVEHGNDKAQLDRFRTVIDTGANGFRHIDSIIECAKAAREGKRKCEARDAAGNKKEIRIGSRSMRRQMSFLAHEQYRGSPLGLARSVATSYADMIAPIVGGDNTRWYDSAMGRVFDRAQHAFRRRADAKDPNASSRVVSGRVADLVNDSTSAIGTRLAQYFMVQQAGLALRQNGIVPYGVRPDDTDLPAQMEAATSTFRQGQTDRGIPSVDQAIRRFSFLRNNGQALFAARSGALVAFRDPGGRLRLKAFEDGRDAASVKPNELADMTGEEGTGRIQTIADAMNAYAPYSSLHGVSPKDFPRSWLVAANIEVIGARQLTIRKRAGKFGTQIVRSNPPGGFRVRIVGGGERCVSSVTVTDKQQADPTSDWLLRRRGYRGWFATESEWRSLVSTALPDWAIHSFGLWGALGRIGPGAFVKCRGRGEGGNRLGDKDHAAMHEISLRDVPWLMSDEAVH